MFAVVFFFSLLPSFFLSGFRCCVMAGELKGLGFTASDCREMLGLTSEYHVSRNQENTTPTSKT